MTWWSEHSATPRLLLARLAIRCRFVDRFVGFRVPSHVSGQRFSTMTPPFAPSGPGEPSSPTSPLLRRRYDFPLTHSWSLMVSVAGSTHASCVRVRRSAPKGVEDAYQAWYRNQPAVPVPAFIVCGRKRDLTGSLAIHPMPLPCSKTPAEPTGPCLDGPDDAAPGLPTPKASARHNIEANTRL